MIPNIKGTSSQKLLQEKCNDIFLVVIIVFFPISIKISNYALFILAFNWLIYVISFREKRFSENRFSVFVNIAPFLFCVLTLLYCKDLNRGLHTIEKLLPLLALPVILSTIASRKSHMFFLRAFSICILLMGAVSFAYGVYNFLFFDETKQVLVGDFFNSVPGRWNALTNINLMRPFLINPIYMSLYISLAFFIFLYSNFSNFFAKSFILGFLIIFQFLIGSRIGLFAFFLSLFAFLVQIGSKERRFYFSILASLIFMASIGLILLNPVLKKRFISDLEFLRPPENIEQWNALNIRIAIWNCSWDVFKQSPVIGYGVKSQDAVRDECYKEKYSFYGPYGTKLNSHNQFIEFALVGGFLLCALFLAQILYSWKIASGKEIKLHLVFIVLFTITCCGESLLETHKGIVFFAVFNSLFIYYDSKQPNV